MAGTGYRFRSRVREQVRARRPRSRLLVVRTSGLLNVRGDCRSRPGCETKSLCRFRTSYCWATSARAAWRPRPQPASGHLRGRAGALRVADLVERRHGDPQTICDALKLAVQSFNPGASSAPRSSATDRAHTWPSKLRHHRQAHALHAAPACQSCAGRSLIRPDLTGLGLNVGSGRPACKQARFGSTEPIAAQVRGLTTASPPCRDHEGGGRCRRARRPPRGCGMIGPMAGS